MPSFKFTNVSPEGLKREKLIKKVLPKEPIIATDLADDLMNELGSLAKRQLIEEIKVYKAYPKSGEYNLETFTPRNNANCFMGQAFKANGKGFENWVDADLNDYRKAVGTIEHPTWGNCTILEIWGGDHFEKYPEMVKAVHEYCWDKTGKLKMPDVHFYINPYIKNKNSGTWDPDPRVEADKNMAIFYNKVANYIEIRDRMKAARVTSPFELELLDKEEI